MEFEIILSVCVLILHGSLVCSTFSSKTISHLLSETKAELAQSFLEQELLKKGGSNIINMTYKNVDKFIIRSPEDVQSFRSLDKNFVFSGVDVYQLQKNETLEGRYSLNAVDDVRLEEGALLFKSIDWKNKIFLVFCYQIGFCEIQMITSVSTANLKMKIDTGTLPFDVNFFGINDELYLIIVQDPVVIYRWTGTYFNEFYRLDTTGAQSVAVFSDNDKSVVVVGQNLGRTKVYSKVYIWENDRFELFQLLPTSQTIRVLTFDLARNDETLHFIFVLNNVQSSSVFWWTGKEFVLWKSLETIIGQRIVYVAEIDSNVFFFISEQKKIYVYHATVTSFNLMQIITLDQEVVGIHLRQEKDQMPTLVLLTDSPLDLYFKVNLILLRINYTPIPVKENEKSDRILQCLSNFKEKLKVRDKKLNKISRKVFGVNATTIISTPEALTLPSLEDSVMDVSSKMEDIQKRFDLVKNISSEAQKSRYQVYGDLKIDKMNANMVNVEVLNDRTLNMENFLSLKKNQTLKGHVHLESLSTDILTVPSVNGISVKDILIKKKPMQSISSEYTLTSLTAKEIKFGPSGRLNEIPFSDIVTLEKLKYPVTGKKSFCQLKVKQVEAEKVNDLPSDEWLTKILPTLKDTTEDEPLNFTSLKVEKLWVSNLNGIPWNDFLSFVNFSSNNETIKGNLSVTGATRVQSLKTKKINGIPFEIPSGRSAMENFTCVKKPPKKLIKSFPFHLTPNWDDSFLKETLNELEPSSQDDIQYFTGTQTIDGNLRATQIFIKNPIELSGSVVDLENITERFWIKSHEQEIRVPVEFKKEISVTNSMEVEKINGNTLDSYVWTDRCNTIFSKIIFEDVETYGNVTLGHDLVQNVNLQKLNETSAKTTEKNLITSRKRFLGKLSAKNLNVDVLNGEDVKNLNTWNKKRLQDSDNIEISELIIYGDLEVKEGVQVKMLNGVDFNETVSKILTWDDPQVLEKVKFTSLKVENLDVDTINGINIEEKLPRLSKTQEKELYLVIEGCLEVPELNVTKVNGINFQKYINQIYQKSNPKTIRGEKIFKEIVTVTGNLKGIINDLNITELDRIALSKTKAQNITGLYTVENFHVNELEAEELDGVSTDQLLFQDDPRVQEINADIFFNNLVVAEDIQAVDFMNGCDLTKVTRVNVENIANFETLDVKGDISWESSREEIRGLSYFLSNAVTRSGDQIISGPVVFENDVVMRNVNGKRYFNDIDLEFISKDAIYRSLPEQEILSPVTFKGSVKARNIQIMDNILVDSINGVDITDIEQRLVRKSADVTVRGKKIFKSGFSAVHFDAETINGAKTNKIVFYDDVDKNEGLKLPPTTFRKLNVFNDMNVVRVNDYPLDVLFEQSLSKTKDDVMNGKLTVEGNVIIKGDANISRINDVNIEETISKNGKNCRGVITGDIEFRDTISILDKLEVDYINGHNMATFFEKALMVDEDATIEGNVKFLSDITVQGNIDINETVSGCNLKEIFQMNFTSNLDKINNNMRKTLDSEVEELSNVTKTMSKPVIFMYLDKVAELNLNLPTIHGSASNVYGNNSVEFNIYGMNHGDCGLPTECYCPCQTNIKIESLQNISVETEVNSKRFFKYYDQQLGVEVKVTTTAVTYSSRCKRSEEDIDDEYTSISWQKFEEGPEDLIDDENGLRGFLSDVKFFKLGESVYIVMAFYFSMEKNQTNNLNTVVYELNVATGKIEKIDEIPSSGAQVLEVFWTTKGVILVVGNSLDSGRFTDLANSGIYRFDEHQNKFELLRFVKTHGILCIKSLRYKKSSFIFFVQKQTWPLMILKYNHEYDNYYFSQKLDTAQSLVRSNFLSVSVIATGRGGYSGDLFVGIVLSDDSFRLFKYKHIEGFVEESYQEQNNVRILQSFWIDSTQYLMAGSTTDTTKIYKLVEQGR